MSQIELSLSTPFILTLTMAAPDLLPAPTQYKVFNWQKDLPDTRDIAECEQTQCCLRPALTGKQSPNTATIET